MVNEFEHETSVLDCLKQLTDCSLSQNTHERNKERSSTKRDQLYSINHHSGKIQLETDSFERSDNAGTHYSFDDDDDDDEEENKLEVVQRIAEDSWYSSFKKFSLILLNQLNIQKTLLVNDTSLKTKFCTTRSPFQQILSISATKPHIIGIIHDNVKNFKWNSEECIYRSNIGEGDAITNCQLEQIIKHCNDIQFFIDNPEQIEEKCINHLELESNEFNATEVLDRFQQSVLDSEKQLLNLRQDIYLAKTKVKKLIIHNHATLKTSIALLQKFEKECNENDQLLIEFKNLKKNIFKCDCPHHDDKKISSQTKFKLACSAIMFIGLMCSDLLKCNI